MGVLDVPLYGRVAALQLFRPPGEPCDLLLLLTERNKFCILGYDEETGAHWCCGGVVVYGAGVPAAGGGCWVCHTRHRRRRRRPTLVRLPRLLPTVVPGELVTWANGDASDRVGRAVELGQRGILDPQCRLIGLHLYDGLFKVRAAAAKGRAAMLSLPCPPAVGAPPPPLAHHTHIHTCNLLTRHTRPHPRRQVIPLDERGGLGEAFNMRLDELKVVDIAFLGEPLSLSWSI